MIDMVETGMTQPKQTRARRRRGKTLFIDLGSSSVKASFVAAMRRAGFKTTTGGIETVISDIIAGRIQYRDRILQSQAESSPN